MESNGLKLLCTRYLPAARMVDFIFEENKSFLHSSLIRRYSVSPNPDRDLELDKDAVSILFVKPHGTLLEGE